MVERGRADEPDDDVSEDDESDDEDLFNEDIIQQDYAPNANLDSYSDADIDDREFEQTTRAQRLAAERVMLRRDRGERVGRAGRRALMPNFLGDDDDVDMGVDGGLLSGINSRHQRRRWDDIEEAAGEDEPVSRSFCNSF